MTSKRIEIAADDGHFDAYLAAPDAGKGPGVILVTHIYGVDRDTLRPPCPTRPRGLSRPRAAWHVPAVGHIRVEEHNQRATRPKDVPRCCGDIRRIG